MLQWSVLGKSLKVRSMRNGGRNYFVFTPLLASTAVGTLEYRCIVEPIRYHAPDVQVIEAVHLILNSASLASG
jgi:NADH dehydrogenase FAD-containing subunit